MKLIDIILTGLIVWAPMGCSEQKVVHEPKIHEMESLVVRSYFEDQATQAVISERALYPHLLFSPEL